ncbi:MAG: hypothetical protein Q4E22_01125, partial [Coriobacteriia bacterium]|nr:hypothetical protein [Coriobacteriia bacterium]
TMNQISDAQKRADAKYKREKMKSYGLRFSPKEMDIWEHLQKQANKSGFIKQLIRDDMNKNREEISD